MIYHCFVKQTDIGYQAHVDLDGQKVCAYESTLKATVNRIIERLKERNLSGNLRVIQSATDFIAGVEQPEHLKNDFSSIVKMMHAAKEHIQYPKIRLETLNGSPIVLHVAGDKSKYRGQIMITDGGRYGDNTYYGRIDLSGTLQPSSSTWTKEIRGIIEHLAEDPEASLTQYGQMTGSCACCGRTLTNPASIERGIGPICAGRFGL